MKHKHSTKKKKTNTKGIVLIGIGLLLIIAALAITIYNHFESKRASEDSQEVKEHLEQQMQERQMQQKEEAVEIPMYQPWEPDINKKMSVAEIEGCNYIGILSIPSLNLELPVSEEWSYDQLKSTLCHYSGSYYTDDMVIAGHNYATHFGPINWIELNSDVYFTSVDGQTIHYLVDNVESLRPIQVEDMVNESDWDLTLFTCTLDGQARYTVRCVRAQ